MSYPGSLEPIKHLQDERVFQRDLFQIVEAAGGTAVTGLHMTLEKDQVVAGGLLAENLRPLGGFPVGHKGVVETGG